MSVLVMIERDTTSDATACAWSVFVVVIALTSRGSENTLLPVFICCHNPLSGSTYAAGLTRTAVPSLPSLPGTGRTPTTPLITTMLHILPHSISLPTRDLSLSHHSRRTKTDTHAGQIFSTMLHPRTELYELRGGVASTCNRGCTRLGLA
jgi:hypothetical protein